MPETSIKPMKAYTISFWLNSKRCYGIVVASSAKEARRMLKAKSKADTYFMDIIDRSDTIATKPSVLFF